MENVRSVERTGTWEFASVAYIDSQYTQPLTVADELESFFHLTLFYAVWLLPHVVADGTANFILSYFGSEWSDGDTRRCGFLKQMAVYSGVLGSMAAGRQLRFLTRKGVFESPLDTLFFNFLRPLQARYEIIEYEKWQAAQPLQPIHRDTTSSAPSASENDNEDEDEMWLPPMQLQPLEEMPWNKSGSPIGPLIELSTDPAPPTEATRTLAARLDTHSWAVKLFEAIRHPRNTPPAAWVKTLAVGHDPRANGLQQKRYARDASIAAGEVGDGPSKRPRTA